MNTENENKNDNCIMEMEKYNFTEPIIAKIVFLDSDEDTQEANKTISIDKNLEKTVISSDTTDFKLPNLDMPNLDNDSNEVNIGKLQDIVQEILREIDEEQNLSRGLKRNPENTNNIRKKAKICNKKSDHSNRSETSEKGKIKSVKTKRPTNYNPPVAPINTFIGQNNDTTVTNSVANIDNVINNLYSFHLNALSKNLLFLLTTYYKCSRFHNSTHDAQTKTKIFYQYCQSKRKIFELSYSTVINIVIPKHKDQCFINKFITDTKNLVESDMSAGAYSHKEIHSLLYELIQWAIQKRANTHPLQLQNPTLTQQLKKNEKATNSQTRTFLSNTIGTYQDDQTQERNIASIDYENDDHTRIINRPNIDKTRSDLNILPALGPTRFEQLRGYTESNQNISNDNLLRTYVRPNYGNVTPFSNYERQEVFHKPHYQDHIQSRPISEYNLPYNNPKTLNITPSQTYGMEINLELTSKASVPMHAHTLPPRVYESDKITASETYGTNLTAVNQALETGYKSVVGTNCPGPYITAMQTPIQTYSSVINTTPSSMQSSFSTNMYHQTIYNNPQTTQNPLQGARRQPYEIHRSSISRDSGFMSPVNNSFDETTDQQELNLPVISHVTSLSTDVTDNVSCLWQRDKKQMYGLL